jgi:hypothetical protein
MGVPGSNPIVRASRRVVARRRSLGSIGRGSAAFFLYAFVSAGLYGHTTLAHFASRCVTACTPDTKFYVWSLRWMPYALANGLNPLRTNLLWAPHGITLSWATSIPGPALVMTPITMLFGPLTSDNVLLVAAPALAGWGMYLVCNQVTRKFWPSVAGGFVFGFSSYIGHFMRGQLNILLVFPATLALYLILRRIEDTIRKRAFVALLALVLVVQFSISLELFATMTLFGAVAFLGVLVLGPRSLRRPILSTGALIGLAYVAAGIVVSPYLYEALRHAPSGLIRPLDRHSADLLSFVLPSPATLIGGQTFDQVTERFLGHPDAAYVGPAFILMLLLFAGRGRRDRTTWLLVGFVALIAVLSLGPTLHIGGNSSVPMPAALIATVPLLKDSLPDRYPVYLWLALGVIAAVWLGSEPRTRHDTWARYVLVGLGTILILQGVGTPRAPVHRPLTAPGFFTQGIYRAYIQPGEIVLPFTRKTGDELVWQAETGMYFRMPHGYVGIYPKRAGLSDIRSVFTRPLGSGGGAALTEFLERHHVRIVIAMNRVPPDWRALIGSAVSTKRVRVAGVSVYRVRAAGRSGSGG